MDNTTNVAKARQFADLAHNTKLDEITREYSEKMRASRNELAAVGNVRSGATVVETARLHGERISALLQARLESLLEGYDLHDVELDAEISSSIIEDLTKYRATLIQHAAQALDNDPICRGIVNKSQYEGFVTQHVRTSPASVKVAIERKRLTKKTQVNPAPVYHVSQGDNARLNVNSQDNSANVQTNLVTPQTPANETISPESTGDSRHRTHKVLLSVLGLAAVAGYSTAQVIRPDHPTAGWWTLYIAILCTVAAIAVEVSSRWRHSRTLFLTISIVIGLIATGIFWRYRPADAEPVSTAPPHQTTTPTSSGPSGIVDLKDSVTTEVRRAQRTIEFNFPTSGERKQKFHVHGARPNLIQIEPKPTGLKEDDLPMDVAVDGGSITVLKFGQEDDGGYIMFDTSQLLRGTRIRGEILGYAEIGAKRAGGKTLNTDKAPAKTGTDGPSIGSVTQGSGSALSVNQSGGITAGTINYLPPQRILTSEQQKILVATLKSVCPFEVAVRGVPGNAESLEYATQITRAIEQAGCKTRRAKFLIDTSAGYGVWIVLHDASVVPNGADALVDAFEKAGIKIQSQTLDAIEPGVVYVMVEFNDAKPPS